jgi:predicted phosphoribosyltransferase
MTFANREEAGEQLAQSLEKYAGRNDVVVLGLPRGGLPVAFAVARRLRVPLDVFLVRKLGVPGFEELALGAIASGGVRVLNKDVLHALPKAPELVESITDKARAEEMAEWGRIYIFYI